jgi:NAD(P)-dependent dehydrogenase (short-subunit alcohol dehydrogenase family)
MNILKSDALAGMTFLVTGASSGIGKAAAILLSECGARVVVNGRDEARLNQTLSELKGAGHLASVASLENADQTTEWLKMVLEQSGPLAGVFHCAGMR